MFIPSNSHTISSRPTFSIFQFPSSSHLVSRISFRPESSFFCLHISTLIHCTSTIPASTITTNRHSSRTLVLISFQYPTSRRYHVWRCLYITTISDCYIFSLSAVCYALLFSFRNPRVIPTVLLPLPWPACSFSSNSLQVPLSGWFLTTHYLTWNSGILNILTLSHFNMFVCGCPTYLRGACLIRVLTQCLSQFMCLLYIERQNRI